MNYLSRKIGVYYTDSKWRDEYFKGLLENIPSETVNRSRNGSETFIELKDGTIIRFVKANSGARASKFHEVFLQPGIEKEIYRVIIAPCIIGYGGAYFVNKLEDFYFRRNRVDNVLNSQK